MESTRYIQDDIEAQIQIAESIHEKAQEEGRGLTLDEQKRWDGILGEHGTVSKLKKDLAATKARQERNAELALQNQAMKKTQAVGIFGSAQPVNQFPGMETLAMNGNTPQTEVRLISQPLKAFKGQDAQRDAYDSGKWLQAFLARSRNGFDESAEAHCSKRGWEIMATGTEGTPSAGGYLVPSPLSNAIIDVRQLAGVSRQLARVMPMTSDTLDVAKKTAGTTVYYPGETGAITDSDQTWGSVNLNAKKRAILSYISQELNDDSIIPIMDDIASQMGLDLAIREDQEFIKGDGTSTFGNVNGLISAVGSASTYSAPVTSGDTWAELTLYDFTETMAKLESKYWPKGVAWLCSSQFYYSVMLNLLADAGGNTIGAVEQGSKMGQPWFLGAPVFFSPQCATATSVSTIAAYFGSFSDGILIGDRLGIRIAQSADYAFNTDRLAIRATSRYDIVAHDVGDATNPGAVIALSTGG